MLFNLNNLPSTLTLIPYFISYFSFYFKETLQHIYFIFIYYCIFYIMCYILLHYVMLIWCPCKIITEIINFYSII